MQIKVPACFRVPNVTGGLCFRGYEHSVILSMAFAASGGRCQN
jgi:hypothetical protein